MTTVADTPRSTFDAAAPWRLSCRVGLRPEPFGALAYHFDTRRLVFLKSPVLVDLVNALADHDDVTAAIGEVVGDGAGVHGRYVAALSSLAEAGVIEPRIEPRTTTAHDMRPPA